MQPTVTTKAGKQGAREAVRDQVTALAGQIMRTLPVLEGFIKDYNEALPLARRQFTTPIQERIGVLEETARKIRVLKRLFEQGTSNRDADDDALIGEMDELIQQAELAISNSQAYRVQT